MRRTVAAIVLTITALAAVTGCASPAANAPGEAKENTVSGPKPTPTDQLIVIDDPMPSPAK